MLTIGVSLWWIVGLRTQGTYGLPILQLTESLRTVAHDSDPTDVLRGIGNWYFYGRDRLGFSIDQASSYAHDIADDGRGACGRCCGRTLALAAIRYGGVTGRSSSCW